ncbi:MAG: hypothetical protein WA254_21145 [Candidatus Sulfotelmatobacter sp.]
MNLQRSQTLMLVLAFGILITGLSTLGIPVLAQANQVSISNSLRMFVGTWMSRTPGRITPFLVLKLDESNGKLHGTMSQFRMTVTAKGRIVGTPEPGEYPIEDLSVTDGELGFVWNGDDPLRGDRVKVVIQGTTRAQLVVMVSAEQIQRIIADNPTASGFNPVIFLEREIEPESPRQSSRRAENWEVGMIAAQINTAEAQYRFGHGTYADYATLLQSGQLKETGGRDFTIPPNHLLADVLPEYRIRLLKSPDGNSYQLSIQEKTGDCGASLFSDETGVIFEGRPSDCSAK